MILLRAGGKEKDEDEAEVKVEAEDEGAGRMVAGRGYRKPVVTEWTKESHRSKNTLFHYR
jgi:hypothetical protein